MTNGNLSVVQGGFMTLKDLRTYLHPDCSSTILQATGDGSVLVLPDLTNIVASECNGLAIQALAGGQILLTNLVQASGILATADGAGTVSGVPGTVNLPALRALTSSQLNINGPGTILAPALPFLQDIGVTVTGGGTLQLPGVVSAAQTPCNSLTWQASGDGSVFVLPALTNIAASECNGLAIQAVAGGQIVLTNLVQATGLLAAADGAGIVNGVPGTVNLSVLREL